MFRSLVLVLLLVGCAATPSRDARIAEMRADAARVEAYCADLFHDQLLDPIRTKVGLWLEADTTFEMLTDHSMPTDIEKAALVIWAKKKEDCQRHQLDSMRRFSPPLHPQLITLYDGGFIRFQILVADLHNESITYGEFTKKRKELNADYRAKKAELLQLLRAETEESRRHADRLAIEERKATAMEQQAAEARYENTRHQLELNRQVTCTRNFNMITCQ